MYIYIEEITSCNILGKGADNLDSDGKTSDETITQ